MPSTLDQGFRTNLMNALKSHLRLDGGGEFRHLSETRRTVVTAFANRTALDAALGGVGGLRAAVAVLSSQTQQQSPRNSSGWAASGLGLPTR